MPRINGIPVSPRARKAIASRNLSLERLQGSGSNGRIVLRDLTAAATLEHGTLPSAMRQAIAKSTTASFTVPQFHLKAEVDATELMSFRQEKLSEIEQAIGVRITVTDLILKALAVALRKFPDANALWHESSIQKLEHANVGLVTSVPGGLHIPVLSRVDSLSLPALARLRRHVVDAARAGKLAQRPEPVAASLSNLGNSRVDEFTAILAQGQTTMLSIGRIAPRPWVEEGKIVVRPTAKLCLTVDHRLLDGEPAAMFLGHIIEGLENPSALFSS